MPGTVSTVLLLLCLLQVKHMFADFYLQTGRMLSGRGTYLHLGRAMHAGVHALGSVIVFAVIGTPLTVITAIVVLEWLVHFHIDFWKAHHSDAKALQPTQAAYWRAMGADQALHQLTYLAMAWGWVEYAA